MDNVGDRSRLDETLAGSPEDSAFVVDVPLVVDLDGTLVATDTLFESALSLIRKNPWSLVLIPLWLCRGKAVLKSEIARRIKPDVRYLPWRQDLIAYLRSEKEAGRKIVLATASQRSTAEAVAAHLDLFDEVLSGSRQVNLKGAAKRDGLVKRFGVRGFDYIGDSRDDAPVWAASRVAHCAGRRRDPLRGAVDSGARAGRTFASPPPRLRVWLRSLRIHQWVKNVLIFVPALLSHHVSLRGFEDLLAAFAAFSFIASATYIINDLFDLEADRRHPWKSKRPFASGDLSIANGLFMALFLLAAGFGLTAVEGTGLAAYLAVYLVLALSYSSFLKNKPIVDVVVLALLYTLRVYCGGVVADTLISPWLFQFSIFSFLSLAFVKRYSELRMLRDRKQLQAPGRGYRPRDLSIVSQAGVGSGMLAGLVLALYVNGDDVRRLYPRPEMLWGICPLFLYWITRVWLIAHRGNMREDPILYAFSDRVSYIVGFLIVALAALGTISRVG